MLSKFLLGTLFSASLVSALCLPAAFGQTGAATANPAGDALIVEMNQAFKRGDRRRLAQLLPQARGHALEPWAAYWELKARLADASAQEVQDFLRRYPGTYQEDRLRNDWLLLLGQRRDWTSFAAEHPQYRMADDREVRCYALLVESIKNGPSPRIAEEVRKNWFAQRDGDDGCTAAAARLAGTQHLTAADVWVKARLATEANRPRAARDAVAIVAPESVELVNELTNSPARFLATKSIAISRVRKEVVVLALIKMATADADGAAAMMDNKWGNQLTAEERHWVWGIIGKQTATRMGTVPAAQALAYYDNVAKNTDLTDDMLGWKARAALRAGNQPRWPLVLGAINAMSEEARREPTWAYWKGRALLSTLPPSASQPVTVSAPPGSTVTVASITIAPQRAEAMALFQSIASTRGFYEQLALEELGQKITVPPKPAAVSAEEKEAARLNPGLNRAAYAIAIGLRPEGVREWNYSTNLAQSGGMSDRELLAAAQFACDRQIWDRCINTSERTKNETDFDQRFPMPFREAVVRRAQAINLDPAYVYGLIRQESRFIMDARSGVGASGLMQVMPGTARDTARYIGLTGFTADQINDRDTNILIGTAYLKRALDDFGGSMSMAAAAYNAGPGRPRTWRGQPGGPVTEAAIWAENVPFNETRDYVKKVLSNTTNYAAILTGQPQSLKGRLGTVGPRDASQPEPDKTLP
ncbi:MAG: lytic transglycosylase protein [Polaromonas sp.]|nr:lytic transglycosylase protein [Polaromonas sp.]